MDHDFINTVLDNCKGLRRDRLLKIASGQLKSGDEEFSQYIKNELVRIRRVAIKNFKMVEKCKGYLRVQSNNLKYFQEIHDIVQAAETQLWISELNELIHEIEKNIAEIGGILSNILRTDVLSEHEVCQLFNINTKTWEDSKARYFKICEVDETKEHLVYNVLAITGPEYRYSKGKMKDIYDCPDSEMPVYWAMHEHMMDAMKNNKEFHNDINNKFMELFPGVKTYKAIKDLEGNIIQVIEDK